MEDYSNPHIAHAMRSLRGAIPRAEADSARPVYHFRAPAQWMDDPNGIIYYNGYYHLFYNHNPYRDQRTSPKHWGHARSKDLIHWEHLPIALWPSQEVGEEDCWFGCTVINGKGQPMMIYTSIGPEKRPEDSAEQWAALGDDDLITWKKHPGNPILTGKIHGDKKVYEWRDPFVFREQGRTFMLLGGKLDQKEGGYAVVTLYEARNEKLTNWMYRGVLFRHPNKKLRSLECPNFLKLGDRWVLLLSPFPCPVEYFVGTFDINTLAFTPQLQGTVDYNTNFYATNILLDDRGRYILWGCILGFKEGRGWNGCFSLPRVLALSSNGWLVQEPAVELQQLRTAHYKMSAVRLTNASRIIKDLKSNTIEILVEFGPGDANNFGLRIRGLGKNGLTEITYHDYLLDVAGTYIPFRSPCREQGNKLHVFVDRTILEVYANGTECATGVVDVGTNELKVELFAHGGNITIRRLDIWEMKSIWS